MDTKNKRLLSLDAFRGLSMFAMLLVDYPGDWDNKYLPLIHADWNGFKLADLIFPSFIFIVGLAITFALAKHKERGDSHNSIMKLVLKRAVILILLGLISNAFLDSEPIYDWHTLRLMGVLQRIAIVYVTCSFLYLKVNIKTLAWISGGILLAYWAIITLIPVPGFGLPDINIHPRDSIANLAAWLDFNILGSHIAEWNKPFDNEGILSTLPAIVSGIIGMLVGHFIKSKNEPATKTAWLFITGGILLIIGYIWNLWLPINKLLWSSSFVLYSAGWSIIIFAAFYWIIDVQDYTKWSKPLQIFGRNAILVFTAALCFQGAYWRIQIPFEGNETAFRWALYMKVFRPLLDDPLKASLLYTFSVILFWYGVSVFLDKKKIYLRV